MGASSEREVIESKMLKLKYKRVEIQEQKLEYLEKLKKITGKTIKRKPIPDYIDDTEDQIISNAKSNTHATIKKNKTKNSALKIKKNKTRNSALKIKKSLLKKEKAKKKIKSADTYEVKSKKNNEAKKKHYQETNQ